MSQPHEAGHGGRRQVSKRADSTINRGDKRSLRGVSIHHLGEARAPEVTAGVSLLGTARGKASAAFRRLALAVLIVAWPARSGAQSGDAPRATGEADTKAEAERLFREGRPAAKAGNPRLACARFEASLRLERTVGTLINLGDCEEKLGHWTSALSQLQQALSGLEGTFE
jgi:hypothetical protein